MPGYRQPTLDELQPTPEELQAQRTAAGAQGTDAAWGSSLGTILGGAAGSLGLLAGQPELIALGAGAGGALGGAIGGQVGGDQAKAADDVLQKAALARQKILTGYQMRQQALDALEATR